jgi:putative tryptophan/tyrosine transport system substrate-binding protein
MRRREFIAGLGAATAVSWSRAARAQQAGRRPRIGVQLGYSERDSVQRLRVATFREELNKLGLGEGRAETIIKWSGTDPDRMRTDAAELIAMSPDVLMASPAQVAMVLQKVSGTIPLVFSNVPDPVAIGLVQSLSHPGGHATGFSNFEHDLAGKWLQVLKEMAPRAARIGVIYSPQNPAWQPRLRVMQATAPALGLTLAPAATPGPADIGPVFEGFARGSVDGVVVLPSIFAAAHRKAIIEAAAATRLPAVYPFRYFAADGGLVAYGIDIAEQHRGAAAYVARILGGEKAGNLPVQLPSKFELVINRKTANALGLEVPTKLLFTADEVIE